MQDLNHLIFKIDHYQQKENQEVVLHGCVMKENNKAEAEKDHLEPIK